MRVSTASRSTEQALGALIRSPQLPQETALEDAQSAMATSPTAPIIASVEDGQLAVQWLSTGRSWEVGGVPPARPDAGLAFSPDGETLAVTDAGALALYGVEAEDNSLRPLGRTALRSVDAGGVAFWTDEPIVVVDAADGLTFIDITEADAVLGPAPAHLRAVRWRAATIPADFCDVGDPVTLTRGSAEAVSSTWGPVVVTLFDVDYGDLAGDAREEAALRVDCNNAGGTAAASCGTASSSSRTWAVS